MNSVSDKIRKKLFSMQDIEYRDFHSKLMPTVERDRIIGVRIPRLRKYAAELSKDKNAAEFLKALPHYYYEENSLHGFLLEKIRDYDTLIEALDVFLPYVDNWATCDMMSFKLFKKHTAELKMKIKQWIESENIYAVRFAIVTLMKFYLTDAFFEESMDWVAGVKSQEYYIKMAVAWYFATALHHQYDTAITYLTERRLDSWTHNKTIRKAIESFRIADEVKSYLRSLSVK